MRNNWRDIPDRYISDRQRANEERKIQQLSEYALAESDVLRKIEEKKHEAKLRKKVLFCLWYALDRSLHKLEQIRDEHAPKNANDEWDDAFCKAIEKMPELRDACEDVWFTYLNIDRPEYFDYV